MANYNWPINPTTFNAGPIQIEIDGVPVVVGENTVDPTLSVPMPVKILNSSGIAIDFNNDYGASSGAIRTASQIGNSTGQADFDAGATGAQTLRVEANQGEAGSTPWPVTGPLTDVQLRATPVGVLGPLTNTELRASPVDIAVTGTLPLPTGAATAANQLLEITDLDAINTSTNEINTKTPPLVGGSVPAVLTAGTAIIGKVSIDQTTPGTTNGVQLVASIPAGTNVIGALSPNQSINVSQINGVTPLMGNGVTGTGSQRVTIASDNTPFGVIASSVINTGTVANITNLVAAAQTFTAPTNAIGFKIQAPSTNTENIAFTIGATATITTGILMEPGRSEDFDTGSNISVIATNASQQRVTVLWKVKP